MRQGSGMGSGMRLGLAVGLLFAAFELVVAAFGPYPIGAGAITWVVATDLSVAAFVAWIAGGRTEDDGVSAGRAAGAVALALLAAYVTPGVALLASEGQAGAAVLVLVPLPVALAAAIAARRIAAWGRAEAVSNVAVAVLAVAASLAPFANPGGGGPEDAEKRSVLLVTVDGLRADAEPKPYDALTTGAVQFVDAVTPTPGSRASHTTVLTGLHPLRHGVLTDRDRLARAFPTLFEALHKGGWTTAAFVSSRAAGRDSGLAQGFDRFDDGWTGAPASAFGHPLLGALLRFGDPRGIGRWSAREDRRTAQQFVAWVRGKRGPWAAWVQLSDPHQVELGGLAASTLSEATRDLAEAIGADPLVVVVGTHGELGGAHGGRGNATLFDEVVHVPLAIRFPPHRFPPDQFPEGPAVPVVTAQVRTLDVMATVLDALGHETTTETEGVSLVGYARGARQASMSCSLVGQDLDGSWLVGVRANRVKVVAGAQDALYLLDSDPGELTDRAAEQPGALAQVRSLISSDRAALDARVR